jgi:hypothetical protein
MANALFCQDNSAENINFSGQPILVGSFITAYDGTPAPDNINYCFEITDVSASGTYTATTNTFSSCYDCLANNYTIVDADFCDGSGSLKIDISEFGFIPVGEQVFYLQLTLGRDTIFACISVGSIGQVSEDNYNSLLSDLYTIDQIIHSNFSLENGCNECLYGFSAGTESTICVVCCPCTTGETISSVSAPHPTWTNGQGQAVIQLNAITLGGPNGLNN